MRDFSDAGAASPALAWHHDRMSDVAPIAPQLRSAPGPWPRAVALSTAIWLAAAMAQAQTAPAAPPQAAVPAAAASAPAAPATPAAPVAAAQAQPVGYIKTVTGEAYVIAGGQRVRAQPGTPVLAGSQVRTLPGASVGITCIDNTLLALGPDTTFTLDEYAYAPAQGKLGLLATLSRGTLNYVSGVIARLQPEAVRVKTPSGIIGVRGTEFAAKVEGAP